MNEEARYALRELRKRITAQAINYAAFPDEFGKGVDYAFTLSIIEIDRMLDEENG